MKIFNIVLSTLTGICVIILIAITLLNNTYTRKSLSNMNDKIETIEKENNELKDKIRTLEESSQQPTQQPTQEPSSYDTSAFTKINASQIESQSKNETIVVMIGRSGCGWCAKYIPVLEQVQKTYKFKAKYIDLTSIVNINTGSLIDQESYEILMNLDAVDKYKTFMEEEFGATPLTLFIKDNKIIYALPGYVDEETLSSIVEELGFKK